MEQVPITTDKISFDEIIENYRAKLNTIDWLTGYTYPCVQKFNGLPCVYNQENQDGYEKLIPDNSIKGYCFFANEKYEFLQKREIKFTVSLIVWVDMKQIRPGFTYDYISELIEEVKNVFKSSLYVSGGSISVDRHNAFDGFDISDNKMFMSPYRAFRLDISGTGTTCN